MSIAAYCCVVALLSYSTWHARSVGGQFTSPRNKEFYVREFSNVTIPWQFQLRGGFVEISWSYRSGRGEFSQIYSVNSTGIPTLGAVTFDQFRGRLSYRGSTSAEDATLGIERFTKQDEGEFKCEVIGEEIIDDEVTLQVIVLSNVTEFKANENNTKEEDDVTLSCTVTKGVPSPNIAILRGNQVLNQTVGSETTETTLYHTFRNISRESSGRYSCRVMTQGYVSRKDYQLRVKYPPRIDKSVGRQYGCIDKMITLTCKADGDPTPNVRLTGPGGEILRDKFLLRTFGIYQCVASNNLGNDSHNIIVSEAKGTPEKPIIVECRFEKLSWTQMSADVKFTLQYQEKDSGRPWQDVITTPDMSYSPSTNESFSNQKTYNFRLIAENCIGKSEPSDQCLVEARESPSSGKRSAGAGVIAGSVIGAVVGILIIVIIAVIIMKRRKRDSLGGSKRQDKQPMTDMSRNTTTPKTTAPRKPGELLYADVAHDQNGSPSRRSQSSQPTNYAEIALTDDPNGPHESAGNSHYANNSPSWV